MASSSPTLCINTALTNITVATTGATGIGTATGLPAGVTAAWATNTITISGTPSASGTFNYSIPLTGGCGSVSATGTIIVSPVNTAAVASSSPTLCINTPLTNITVATTGATGISNSGVSGSNSLPAGVSASWLGSVITISGTPSASGTFNYSIPLTGGCGTVNATGTIIVTPAMTAGVASSSPSLCISTVMTSVTHTTTLATGISNTGVSGANGLPAGVSASWSGSLITISGTPSASGTFNYSIPLTGGCGSVSATGTITVNALPSTVTITPSATVCLNSITTLTASSTSSGSYTIGTATGTALAATTPYRITSTSTARMQYLVTKAELNSAGITGAQNITSLGFNVTAVGTSGSISSYVINMANTSVTVLTTTYQSPTFTQVYSSSYTVISGVNSHTFSTPFAWDGTSNVLINICMAGPSLGTNPSVDVLTAGFTGTTTSSNITACSSSTSAATLAIRPVIYFGASISSSITWTTNTTGLWTDTTANTTAYTNQVTGTVYAKPSSTQTYTATATGSNGCTITGTSTLTLSATNTWVGGTSTDWNTAANWSCSAVPTSSSNVSIPSGTTYSPIISSASAVANSITINYGAILTMSGQTLTITSGGSFTNSGTFTAGTGTVAFAGSGTITGTVVFNSITLAGAVSFSTAVTVNGTLSINAGGSITTNAPIYGNASTLKYNTGSNPHTRGIEWSANGVGTINSTVGYPNNVQVSGSTTFRCNTTNNVTTNAGAMAGSLTIDSGSAFYSDYGAGSCALTIAGDLTMNGNFSLGGISGGDLTLGGNWTRANSGASFNSNGRLVTFNKVGTQVITTTGGGTESFAFVSLTNGSTLQLSSSPATNVTITSASGLTLTSPNTTSSIDLNGQIMTISGGGNLSLGSGTRNITSTISGGVFLVSGANLAVTSGGTLSFAVSNSTLKLSVGFDCGVGLTTVNGNLQLENGGYINNNAPNYGSSSTLIYNSGTTYGRGTEWSSTSGAGYPNNVQISGNTTLDVGANGGTGTARQIAGNLTTDSGSTFTMNNDPNNMTAAVTVKGNVNNNTGGTIVLSNQIGGDLKSEGNITDNGTFTFNSRAVFFQGNNTQDIQGSGTFDIPFVRINKGGGSVRLLTDLTCIGVNGYNSLEISGTTSILDLNGRLLNLGATGNSSTYNSGISPAGYIRGSSSSTLNILGDGALGTIYFDPSTSGNVLNNLTINRANSGSVVLGNTIAVSNALTITNGNVDLGTNIHTAGSLTLNGTLQTPYISSYGGTSSPAATINSTYFADKTGVVNVGNCSSYSLTSTTATACLGSGAIVTLTNTTPTNLPAGTYTVYYTLSGANSGSTSATMIVTTPGTGSFTTTAISNNGTPTTISIDYIRNGCVSKISAGNTATITVNAVPTVPSVGTITQPTCSTATGSVALSGLPATGSWTVTGSPSGSATGTGTTGLVTGLAAVQTYTFTVTNSSGCTSVATGNAVVNAQPVTPTAPSASMTQPTCSTATGTITVTSPAVGTGITYTVTGTSPVVASVTNTTGIFAGLTTGTYDVTTTNGVGCTSLPTSKVIAAQPVTPTAPSASMTQPTCSTATGTITVTSPAVGTGITYTVTGTSPVVASVTNTTGIFAGLTTGTYDVTTTNGVGCTSLPTSKVIAAQPVTPTVTASVTPTTVCAGGTVNLTGVAAMTTYSWSGPTGATFSSNSAQSPTVTMGSTGGTFTLTATNSDGCSASATTGSVTVNALPTITLGYIDDVTNTATSFSIPYTATTGTTYSITTSSPTSGSSIAMPGFNPLINAGTIASSPIVVTIPASASAEYNFNLTITNASSGCSNVYPFQFHVSDFNHGVIGANQTICYNTAPAPLTNITSASGSYGGTITYTWEQSSSINGGYTTINGATSDGYSPGALTETTYFKRVAHDLNPGATEVTLDSDPVKITVDATSVGGSVTTGKTQAVCTGTSPSDIAITGYTGNVVRWEQSATSDFAIPTSISSTATTLASATIGALSATTYYRAVVKNGVCNEVYTSDYATVTVNETSVGGSVTTGKTQAICSGSSPSDIAITGNTGSVVRWEKATTSNFVGYTTIVSTSTTLASATIGTLSATTYFRAVVQSGVCSEVYTLDYATVTVTTSPSAGTLSGTEAVCSSSTTTFSSTELGGTWTSGNTAVAIIADSTKGVISPVSAGTSLITYTVTGTAGCIATATRTVTVTSPPIGGLATADADYVCSGGSTTIRLSGNSGGTIQWQQSANGTSPSSWTSISGATTTTYTTPALGATTYYRAMIVSNGVCSDATSSVVMVALPVVAKNNTLTNQGLCSGTVQLSGNIPIGGTGAWSVTSGQNSSTYSINDPALAEATFTTTIEGDYVFRWTITYDCGSSFDDTALMHIGGGTLTPTKWNGSSWTTWNGSVWANSAPPTSSSTAIIAGNYSSATNGSITACTLTINSNAVVNIATGDNVNLNGALTVVPGGSFTIENNASLVQSSNVANSGIINVKHNSSALLRLDYTLWSSPVADQNLVLFSPVTSRSPSRFYTYNTSLDLYDAITTLSLSTTSFAPAKGYLIRMPNDWNTGSAAQWTGTFKGIPNNGNITYSMSTAGKGYNAVGNPYPSAIDFSKFINANKANIEGTVYFWRKTNNSSNPISYSTCSRAGCTVNNGHTYTNFNLISVGQGFIVKAKSSQLAQLALNFDNAMRSTSNVAQFFRATAVNRYWLELSNTAAVSFGKKLIAYVPDATLGYDDGLDGLFLDDTKTALLSVADAHDLVIQARPDFTADDVVPLVLKTDVADTYTITLQEVEGIFNGSQTVYLKDKLTNTAHDFSTGAYTFTSDAGRFDSRFEIVYQNPLAVNQPTFSDASVVVYKQNNELIINSGNTTMTNVKVFDIRGRLLMEKNNINATQTKFYTGTTNEVLLVQITSDAMGTVTKKVIN